MKRLGIILVVIGLLSHVGGWLGWQIPIVKWLDLFGSPMNYIGQLLCVAAGILLLIKRPGGPPNPLSVKKWNRFKSIRRGYVSLWILGILVLVAGLDNLLVGKRALVVNYHGQWHFPFLKKAPINGNVFGIEPGNSETDYRSLQKRLREDGGGWVLMPPVPYDARLDTPVIDQAITLKDGIYVGEIDGKPCQGKARTSYVGKPDSVFRDVLFRQGKFSRVEWKDETGETVKIATYQKGVLTAERKVKEVDFAALEAKEDKDFRQLMPSPCRPSFKLGHYLGTDSSGADILAVLVGGFQMVAAASFFFLLFVYVIGFAAGSLMGYLGGGVDLTGQRLVEIWSALPFLYIVILVRSLVQTNLVILVGIMALFSWMGLCVYMRTATYRERARDYVAAARLSGAGTMRVVFHHIFPNVLSTMITLIPFRFDALVLGLTSLDYLGFGLPPGEPSWGALLKDGTTNLHAPWIVSAAFAVLAATLILVTFVGEAVREAYDPKKFTYYR